MPFRNVSFLGNASSGDEIDCKAPQPMTAFVMLARHRCQSSTSVLLGCRRDHGQAFIAFGQTRRDTFQHPCAAQVEPIQMCQLRVTGIGRHHRLQRSPSPEPPGRQSLLLFLSLSQRRQVFCSLRASLSFRKPSPKPVTTPIRTRRSSIKGGLRLSGLARASI